MSSSSKNILVVMMMILIFSSIFHVFPEAKSEFIDPNDFKFRRSINISKTSSFNETEDVLLEIDTTDVNCDSIRLTTTDYELLEMYLESLCRLKKTRIWVRLNTNTEMNVKEIEIYYFTTFIKETGGISKFINFNGSFFVFQNGECSKEWEEMIEWDGRFVRISNPGKGIEVESLGGSERHSHVISVGTDENGISEKIDTGGDLISGLHKHKFSFLTDNRSNVDDIDKVKKTMCSSKGILNQFMNETFFFTLNISNINNNGLTYDEELLGKFFIIGKAIDQESSQHQRGHTHLQNYPAETILIIKNSPEDSGSSCNTDYNHGYSSFGTIRNHQHGVNVGIKVNETLPQHKEIGVLMSNSELEYVPKEPLIFLTNEIPPIGYKRISLFNGLFFVAGQQLGIESGRNSHKHYIDSISITEISQNEFKYCQSKENIDQLIAFENHVHILKYYNCEYADHTPPYVSLHFAERMYNKDITVEYGMDEYMCFGIPYTEEESCFGKRGECLDVNKCRCLDYYIEPQTNCTKFKCNNIGNDEPGVCSEHGICLTNNSCNCDEGYEGDFCDTWSCFGFRPDSPNVCSGKGMCKSFNDCECKTGWSGDNCNEVGCFGIPYNDKNVCSGHGVCKSGDCICEKNYSATDDCSWECAGIQKDNERVCGGKGKCIDFDVCNCTNQGIGLVCGEGYMCFGVSSISEKVCSGHGSCVSINKCLCRYDYNETENCGWSCYGIKMEDEEVCSGNGECSDKDKCECNEGYIGKFCDSFQCKGLDPGHPSVCSRSGMCNAPDNCSCRQLNTYGKDCEIHIEKIAEWENLYDTLIVDYSLPSTEINSDGEVNCSEIIYMDDLNEDISSLRCMFRLGYWMTENLNITGWKNGKDIKVISMKVLSTGEKVEISIRKSDNSIFEEIFYPLLGGFSFLIFVVVVIAMIVVVIFYCLYQKKKKIADVVGELGEENLDMILEEVRLENTTDAAKLRVSKNLLQIDYSSLKILNKIGQGGSNSTVYLCEWNSKTVAYKCFKINTSSYEDNVFEEFEKEASILSSISHPSILTFYGCTLKPPRVGIVMEFAKNGDMKKFLIDYEKENGKPFNFDGKMKFLCDVASAMEYIHERKILHRDLKSENVLITEHYDAKLMDFGLSKVIKENQEKTTRIGTSYYMAPELMKGIDYGPPCDVFSFSMVMFEVLTNNFKPFGKSDFHVENKIAVDPNFRPEMRNVRIKKWLKDIITTCWNDIPEERLTFKMIHQIFIRKAQNLEKKPEKEEKKNVSKDALLEIEKRIKLLEKTIIKKNRRITQLENEKKKLMNINKTK